MENNSSPHKARNYQGIVNDVLMYLHTPATSGQAAVLVEGPDDAKIYRKFFDQNMARIFVCTGKNDLQKALPELSAQTEYVIGIRDADFSHLEDEKPESPNLFFTDYHDIEMTMVHFEEIRRALFSEYYDDNFDTIDSIWKSIVKDASFTGYIRWFSKNKSLTKTMVSDFIATHRTDDIFNLCNGHDVIALLVRVFKINTKQVTAALRLSFHREQFVRTVLYRELLAWQTDHGMAILYSRCEEPRGSANGSL
jgi:hypothetical protein